MGKTLNRLTKHPLPDFVGRRLDVVVVMAVVLAVVEVVSDTGYLLNGQGAAKQEMFGNECRQLIDNLRRYPTPPGVDDKIGLCLTRTPSIRKILGPPTTKDMEFPARLLIS